VGRFNDAYFESEHYSEDDLKAWGMLPYAGNKVYQRAGFNE